MQPKNLIEKIDSLIPESFNSRHSYFQLQFFVVGKQPTVQAKLRICQRELMDRRESIENALLSMEEGYDDIRLLEIAEKELISNDVASQDDKFANEKREIKLRKLARQKSSLYKRIDKIKQNVKEIQEEANFLIGLYERLLKLEPLKDWDNFEVQLQYWNAKLTQDIESRLMLGNKPDSETLLSVHALPHHERATIKGLTNNLVKECNQKLLEDNSKGKTDG